MLIFMFGIFGRRQNAWKGRTSNSYFLLELMMSLIAFLMSKNTHDTQRKLDYSEIFIHHPTHLIVGRI